MEPRRAKDLAQLSDQDFFAAVSDGLALVHENAVRLWQSAKLLAEQHHFRGAEIIKGIAEEEAAKYLLLLDAVRCPRKPDSERFARQLGKFNRHLARGLYAEICDWRPVDLREVRAGIERECQAYYLDGPNDVDWIFRNDIERKREEALYVDYVQYDHGHEWVSPEKMERLNASMSMFFREPTAVRLISTLHAADFASPESLAVIAQIWRSEEFGDDARHDRFAAFTRATLQALADKDRKSVV